MVFWYLSDGEMLQVYSFRKGIVASHLDCQAHLSLEVGKSLTPSITPKRSSSVLHCGSESWMSDSRFEIVERKRMFHEHGQKASMTYCVGTAV